MRYFVFAEDGNKYGPAEVSLLNQWIEEGRLLPGMMLEEDGSHHRVAAASVGGLDFYVLDEPSTTSEAGPIAAALSYEPPAHVESVQVDIGLGFAMVVATLLFSLVRGPIGVLGLFTAVLGAIAAIKARERGSELSQVALIANVLGIVAWIASRVIFSLN